MSSPPPLNSFISTMIQGTDKPCKFVDPLTRRVVYETNEEELSKKSLRFKSKLRKKKVKREYGDGDNAAENAAAAAADATCTKCGFEAESKGALRIHLKVAHKVSTYFLSCLQKYDE